MSELYTLPLQQGGKIIHFDHDGHGRILVIDRGDYRILSFDSLFEQSSMLVSQPHQLVHQYTQLMLLVLTFINPIHITLLGLGGGSLLRTLHHLLPNCNLHAIEIRPLVVEIAKDYFSLPNSDSVVLSVSDALEKVTSLETASTDIIFSDLYDAYQMVAGQLHPTFLIQCHRILSSQGWLVCNLHKFPANQKAFFTELRQFFPTIILTTVADNSILFISKTQPQEINLNLDRLETMESVLQQQLLALIPRLQPLGFKFN